jgi:hypothetical protein
MNIKKLKVELQEYQKIQITEKELQAKFNAERTAFMT